MTEKDTDKTSSRPTIARGVHVEPELILWFAERSTSQADLASKLDIHRTTLRLVLARAGLTTDDVVAHFVDASRPSILEARRARGRQQRERRAQERQKIIDLYVNDLLSIKEIADTVHRSGSSIHRTLKLAGVDTTRQASVDTPDRGWRPNTVRPELINLLCEHFSDVHDMPRRAEDAVKEIMSSWRVTRKPRPRRPRPAAPPAAGAPSQPTPTDPGPAPD